MTTNDWTLPTLTDDYPDVLTLIKDLIKKAVTHTGMDSDTNVYTGALRINSTSLRWERYTGTTWVELSWHADFDAHVADTAIHGGVPVGSVVQWLTGTPPTNYFILDGVPKSRTTYAALFGVWGTTFGVGDGSTTFGVPDMRGRIPIGKSAGGTSSAALGSVFGTIDHAHAGPSHTHAVASHTHGMQNHTHTGPSHSHTMGTHVHNVPAHSHDTQGASADIAVASSGNHIHNYGVKGGGGIAGVGSGGNRALNASSAGTNETNTTTNDSSSNHAHPHSSFTGRVGNVSSGFDGDGTFLTGASGTAATDVGGTGATGVCSPNLTDPTALTTDAGGTGDTGTANPPCMIVHWCVKYQ